MTNGGGACVVSARNHSNLWDEWVGDFNREDTIGSVYIRKNTSLLGKLSNRKSGELVPSFSWEKFKIRGGVLGNQ